MATAALHAAHVGGAIICDSPVTESDPEIGAYQLKEAFGQPRTYVSAEEALARFRTVPPQEHYVDYVLDHVARHSLKPVGGGWRGSSTGVRPFAGGMRSMRSLPLGLVPSALLRSENGLSQ